MYSYEIGDFYIAPKWNIQTIKVKFKRVRFFLHSCFLPWDFWIFISMNIWKAVQKNWLQDYPVEKSTWHFFVLENRYEFYQAIIYVLSLHLWHPYWSKLDHCASVCTFHSLRSTKGEIESWSFHTKSTYFLMWQKLIDECCV